MSDLHMAGGLRFADAGANHFPSFRGWPKTFGDLISSDAHMGHFRVFIPLAAVDPQISTGGGLYAFW